MGKAPIPTVVGGGIGLVPGAVGEFLVITNLLPPFATGSPRLRRSGTDIIIGFTANPNSTAIGPGVISALSGGVVNDLAILIGSTVSASGAGSGGNVILASNVAMTGGNNIIIGPQLAAQWGGAAGTSGNSVIVGSSFNPNNAIQNGLVAVGANIAVTGATGATVIGQAATYTGFGNGGVVIGQGAAGRDSNVIVGKAAGGANGFTVIVGNSSTGTGTTDQLIALGNNIVVASLSRIIAIGNNASPTGLAAGDIIIGHNNAGGGGFSSRVVWGGANLHTAATIVPAWTFRHKNAQGNDIAAGSVTFIAPLATGNAAGGSFIFQTGPAGGAGAALQVATTRLTITPNGVAVFDAPTVAAENIVVNGVGGAGQASIRLNGLTNGAGALAGSLLNSPVLGDPTFWIPVSVAGAVKHIPAW